MTQSPEAPTENFYQITVSDLEGIYVNRVNFPLNVLKKDFESIENDRELGQVLALLAIQSGILQIREVKEYGLRETIGLWSLSKTGLIEAFVNLRTGSPTSPIWLGFIHALEQKIDEAAAATK